MRDRIEMVLLAGAGWAAGKIATHLSYRVETVRRALRGYERIGEAIFTRTRPGPHPNPTRRARIQTTLDGCIGEERTWNAPQLREALQERTGIALSARQTRRYLHAMGARYNRTTYTLRHKQDPARVARSRTVLTALEKKA